MPTAPPRVAPAPLPPLTCAVLDDELLPRLTVLNALQQHPSLHCLGHFASLAALREAALPAAPAVLFLDIELGTDNGPDYFKSLPAPPLTVFVTSHPEYALDSI